MFCDLVDSTLLSGQLDPEDLRDVLREYQDACTAVIARFDGWVAQYLGDGILAYFGYPTAHEDDPRRAVAAGLEILAVIAGPFGRGASPAVRLGIHTGVVVAGRMGSGNRREDLAVGETPNLAARLQKVAKPNTLLVSAATHRLIRGYFTSESLGPQALKGVCQPIDVYRVTGLTQACGRLDATAPDALAALVGRDREVARLQALCKEVRRGAGKLVLLSGEPGIGKSRLLKTCVDRMEAGAFTRLRYFCSEHHTQSPLYPVISQMERAAGFVRGDSSEARYAKLKSLLAANSPSADELALLAELLSIPSSEQTYQVLDLSPERRREKTFAALVRQVESLASRGPVLMMFEDAHWVDPSSRELLDTMAARIAQIPVLVIVTFRPEFHPPWAGLQHAESMGLHRLDAVQSVALIQQVAGGSVLLERTLREIVERSDGIPLFLEELTRAVVAAAAAPQGSSEAAVGADPVVPETLHSSLLARLDRLGPVAKEVTQVAAAIGRQFHYRLLAAVLPESENELTAALDALDEAALLSCRGRPPEATYYFRHALVRDAAYATLLRGRRRALHAAIAHELALRHSDDDAVSQVLLAHHFTQAGKHHEAVRAWRSAARASVARGSFAEAQAQLRSGLELLAHQPQDSARDHQEVTLQNALGNVLIAQRGFTAPETLAAFERARALAAALGDPGQGLRALWGLGTALLFDGRPGAVLEMMKEAAPLVEKNGHLDAQLAFSVVHGSVLLDLGRPGEACRQLEHTLATDTEPQRDRERAILYGQSPRISALAHLSIASLILGRPAQSLEQSNRSVLEAQALAHKPMVCLACAFACRRHWLARDRDALARNAAMLHDAAAEQGTPIWLALSRIHFGWNLAEQGCADEGIALMVDGLREYREVGAGSAMPLLLLALGRACARAERATKALVWLAEALQGGSAGEERWIEAEVHRERAKSYVSQGDLVAARDACRKAIDVARSQGASLFESRAQADLDQLLRTQPVQSEPQFDAHRAGP